MLRIRAFNSNAIAHIMALKIQTCNKKKIMIDLTLNWSADGLNNIEILGLDMSDEELKGLFEKFDTDGSGSINVTEFLQGVRVRSICLL